MTGPMTRQPFAEPAWRLVPDSAWCGTMAEAHRWAATAHESYRKAVCLAAFEAMSPENQRAFLQYVQGDRR